MTLALMAIMSQKWSISWLCISKVLVIKRIYKGSDLFCFLVNLWQVTSAAASRSWWWFGTDNWIIIIIFITDTLTFGMMMMWYWSLDIVISVLLLLLLIFGTGARHLGPLLHCLDDLGVAIRSWFSTYTHQGLWKFRLIHTHTHAHTHTHTHTLSLSLSHTHTHLRYTPGTMKIRAYFCKWLTSSHSRRRLWLVFVCVFVCVCVYVYVCVCVCMSVFVCALACLRCTPKAMCNLSEPKPYIYS